MGARGVVAGIAVGVVLVGLQAAGPPQAATAGPPQAAAAAGPPQVAAVGPPQAAAASSRQAAAASSRQAASASKCRHAGERPGKLTRRQLENSLECLINKKRQAHGRSKLKEKGSVSKAAARHTRHMLETGCFDHNCAGEPDLSGRVHSTAYLPCGCSWSLGENLAWGDGKKGTPAQTIKSWMRSPGHRANILTRGFEHVGVGASRGRPGKAGAQSSGTYTVVFGSRD